MVLFLPRHATAFEGQCKRSSYPLLRAAVSSAYVKQHVKAWWKVAEYDQCCPFIDSRSKRVNLLVPEQLAIAHELFLYVQQYLHQTVGTIVPHPERTPLVPLTEVFQRLGLPRSRNQYKDIPNSTGIRWLAIFYACRSPTPTRSDILKAILKADPAVDDSELLFVLRHACLDDLQTVISCFPSGGLSLRSAEDFRSHSVLDFIGLPSKFSPKRKFGPLWELVKRDVTEDTENIFELLLRRGEDVNGKCGPQGTAIHGTLSERSSVHQHEMLELLIRKGASLHVSGPNGNALEFVWKIANEQQQS